MKRSVMASGCVVVGGVASCGVATGQVLVQGNYAVEEAVTVTLRVIDNGMVLEEASASSTLRGTATSLVELNILPVVPDDIFGLSILDGRLDSLAFSIDDFSLSLGGLDASLSGFQYLLGDGFGSRGTFGFQSFGAGQAFLDESAAENEYRGDLLVQTPSGPIGLDLASLGPGEVDLFTFYDISFDLDSGEFRQSVGIDNFNFNSFEFAGVSFELEVSLDSGAFSVGAESALFVVPASGAALPLGVAGLAFRRRR